MALNKLSDVKLRKMDFAALAPKLISDGGGLYLRPAKGGSASWVMVYNRFGKRTELGLGGYPATTLANARQQAANIREQLAEGVDPKEEKRKVNAVPTLRELAAKYKAVFGAGWSESYSSLFDRCIERHLKRLADKPVNRISAYDIQDDVVKLMHTTPTSARKTIGVASRVFGYAVAHRMIEHNPARWEDGLKYLLPKIADNSTHFASIHYDDAPALFKSLMADQSVSARALVLQMLTGVRPTEASSARWEEFDLDRWTWTIPAERMKQRKPHTAPLSQLARDLLLEWKALAKTPYVFPSNVVDAPIHPRTVLSKLHEHAPGSTRHGLRSTLREWLGAKTDTDFVTAEEILSHAIGDAVTQAYYRQQSLEKMGRALTKWAEYLNT